MGSPNIFPKSRDEFPYLVDIQSDLLSGLATRMVVPLASSSLDKAEIPQRLSPIIPVAGKDYRLLPYQAAPLLQAQLKEKVDAVKDYAYLIVDAMDAVISGL